MPAVEEIGPLLRLIDKDGRLHPVPGFTLEQFEELYRLQNRLVQEDRGPSFSIQELTIQGTAGERAADLTVRLKVLVGESGWVRVPLAMREAVLREPPEYQGSGEQFVAYDESDGGYVSWIHSASSDPHSLEFKVFAPLDTVGGQTRLRLRIPRATTSKLTLEVPLARVEAQVPPSATLEPMRSLGEGRSEVAVIGLAGDFVLQWFDPGDVQAETPQVVEAAGEVLVRYQSRSMEAEATFTVRVYGAPLDRFRVRLPEGTQWVPPTPEPSDYTLVAAPAEEQAPQRAIVEVRFPQPVAGPVQVKLAARQPQIPAGQPNQWIAVPCFEVVGAERQSGHVVVAAAEDWQVQWGPSRGVQRIDHWPELLDTSDAVAGFEYSTQPYSLSARLVPRKTRTSVEPVYLVLVGPESVDLQATLKYTVRQAKAFAFDLKANGWQIDRVEPETLVAADGLTLADDGSASIALREPSAGDIQLGIRAHRAMPAPGEPLEVPLPEPQADALGPAAVIVQPADNVEIIPNVASIVGLTRQQIAPSVQLPGLELPRRQQQPLFYRGESGPGVFSAHVRQLPQDVRVEVETEVSLQAREGRVSQRFAYTVAHEAVECLLLDVPAPLAREGVLEVRLDGQLLKALAVPPPAAPAAAAPAPSPASAAPAPAQAGQAGAPPAELIRMQVDLPEARIGACELQVRYPLRFAPLVPLKRVVVEIPLVVPVDGRLGGNRLNLTAAEGIAVQRQSRSWRLPAGNEATAGTLRLTADRREASVRVSAELQDQQDSRAVVIDRAWIRTLIDPQQRLDRATFLFSSRVPEVELLLPAEVQPRNMQVLLDGSPTSPFAAGEGRWVMALPSGTASRQHRLEVWYQFPDQRPPQGPMTLEVARLGRDSWTRRLYWQLLLPANEHVLHAPQGFTDESSWQWQGYYWGRRPTLDTAALEQWMGVEASDVPAASDLMGANEYLFSAMGRVERATLRTASRSWIVLVASGGALVAGLLLVYVSFFRRPAVLLTIGILVLSAGFLYPEPALLAAQAASIGLALALVAGLLESSFVRRRSARPFLESASQVREKGSTQTFSKPPGSVGPPSTETAALPAPASAESHP